MTPKPKLVKQDPPPKLNPEAEQCFEPREGLDVEGSDLEILIPRPSTTSHAHRNPTGPKEVDCIRDATVLRLLPVVGNETRIDGDPAPWSVSLESPGSGFQDFFIRNGHLPPSTTTRHTWHNYPSGNVLAGTGSLSQKHCMGSSLN